MLELSTNQSVESTTQEFTIDEIATMKKVINFAKSIIDSLNTGAVANLASTINSLGIMLESINTPEMQGLISEVSDSSQDLTVLLKQLSNMQEDGTLDSLMEMATFISAVKKSMSSDIILKMTSVIPEPKVINTVEKLIEAANDTNEEVKSNPPNISIFSLPKMLKDPEMQYLLGFLTVFVKKFTKITNE